MMSKEMPVFKNDKEAAKFWDRTDATEYMNKGKLEEFIWKEVEDRCDNCGSKMKKKLDDIEFHNNQVTIHKVVKYRCPHCGKEKFSTKFKKEIPLIAKDLVEMALK